MEQDGAEGWMELRMSGGQGRMELDGAESLMELRAGEWLSR